MKPKYLTWSALASLVLAINYFAGPEKPVATGPAAAQNLTANTYSVAQMQGTQSEIRQFASPDSRKVDAGNDKQVVWQPSIAAQPEVFQLALDAHVEYIQVQPVAQNLKIGQKLALFIPQENRFYSGTVTESSVEHAGAAKIVAGELDDGTDFASFSLIQGKTMTFATVATGSSIYQVEIDNRSGIGIVMDNRELEPYSHPDDGILPPPEGIS